MASYLLLVSIVVDSQINGDLGGADGNGGKKTTPMISCY